MMRNESRSDAMREVTVEAAGVELAGNLARVEGSRSIVVFAHGSGSSRFSPRNQAVARSLNAAGFNTLLFDLLTAEENVIDERTRALRFDISRLGDRLTGTLDWLRAQEDTASLDIGLFGASTGAAAALVAAAERPQIVSAVVSRGGRPDLAGDHLPRVKAPVLLIVGGFDTTVIGMNQDASARLTAEHKIEIVPGATHLFEEPGKLEEVSWLASEWFGAKLASGH